eukprot:318570_1
MALRFPNLINGVWVFALAAVVHALNDILTDSESESADYSIIEGGYYAWRESQEALKAKKAADAACISIVVFIVVLLVALLMGSGSTFGIGYFFCYKKKMTAKEEEIDKLKTQIEDKEEDIKNLGAQIANLKASPTNDTGPNPGDAPDSTEIARLKKEVQTLKGELDEMTEELTKAKNTTSSTNDTG